MKKKIVLLEPYFTGSHRQWAEGYANRSRHEVTILHLSGHYWKWRMHGGAVTLAGKFLKSGIDPDLILATDMLDLTTFLALTRRETYNVPAAVYFHENQLTYPWSPRDRDLIKQRDGHYTFINYSSALAADAVFFNSGYHRDAFLGELPNFLRHFPDNNELASIDAIKEKSRVMHLGLDLLSLDHHTAAQKEEKGSQPPLILWNHRWEYDKNPRLFFESLYRLREKGVEFSVAILGECFSKRPVEFEEARERLGPGFVQYGYCREVKDYARWLWKADILPVTSRHDFFGASVVEAMYCNCYPLLPRRLAYPEHLPLEYADNYYDSDDDLVEKLEKAILNISEVRSREFRSFVEKYDWRNMAARYDEVLDVIFR